MKSEHSAEVRASEHISVEDPELVLRLHPRAICPQSAGASKELRFFDQADANSIFPLAKEFDDGSRMGVSIHQYLGDSMLAAQCQPDFEHGDPLDWQQALGNRIRVRPQSRAVPSGEQKSFHAEDAMGMKVQRDALCSSLSMNGSLTRTCAP